MFKIHTPTGHQIEIPSSHHEDAPYFTLAQAKAAAAYFSENGYVVIRNCVAVDKCHNAMQLFKDEVKPYAGHLYRQTGGNPEVNKFNNRNFVMNPILNVQDVPTSSLGRFRDASLSVICSDGVDIFLKELCGEKAKLVQSMYFEGNSQTWPHQDTYYLDSENIGSMVAAWFAVEDIHPGAGRFFVYPKSHLIDIAKNGGDFDVAFNHERYKILNKDIIEKFKLQCVAPALRAGDVLFWHSKTIHGSLETRQPEYSRSSLTAHFIPETHRFLQFQSALKKLRLQDFKGWRVHHPKSLDTVRAKSILFLEITFPKTFQFLKWSAVKLLITK